MVRHQENGINEPNFCVSESNIIRSQTSREVHCGKTMFPGSIQNCSHPVSLTLITVVSPLLRVRVCSLSFLYNHKWSWEPKVELFDIQMCHWAIWIQNKAESAVFLFCVTFLTWLKAVNWNTSKCIIEVHTHSYCQQVWNCYLKPEGGSTVKLGKLKP